MLCAPTHRACPQNSYLHLVVRGITVVLCHCDTIVGEQPGKLCTQEALDTVYWFIRSSKIPEFDFPITPCRYQEMTEKKPRWDQRLCERVTCYSSHSTALPLYLLALHHWIVRTAWSWARKHWKGYSFKEPSESRILWRGELVGRFQKTTMPKVEIEYVDIKAVVLDHWKTSISKSIHTTIHNCSKISYEVATN